MGRYVSMRVMKVSDVNVRLDSLEDFVKQNMVSVLGIWQKPFNHWFGDPLVRWQYNAEHFPVGLLEDVGHRD